MPEKNGQHASQKKKKKSWGLKQNHPSPCCVTASGFKLNWSNTITAISAILVYVFI